MSLPEMVALAQETTHVCCDCGEFVMDEGICFSCICGVYFAYDSIGGPLVKPRLPAPDRE